MLHVRSALSYNWTGEHKCSGITLPMHIVDSFEATQSITILIGQLPLQHSNTRIPLSTYTAFPKSPLGQAKADHPL